MVVDASSGGSRIVFVGRAPGPETAVYLRDVCLRAVARETKLFKSSPVYKSRRSLNTKRRAISDFVFGLVRRLALRLLDLFAASISKRAIEDANRALSQQFPTAIDVRSPLPQPRFREAASAGWRAGGEVAINHGVYGASERMQIGRSPS